MTELFTRHGTTPHTGGHSLDEKGRPVLSRKRQCSRCGGAGGGNQWRHTGWTCFSCGGSGHRGTEVARLFTAEEIAKLNVAQEKRAVKKRAALDAAHAAKMIEVAARRTAFEAEFGALIAAVEPFSAASPFVADVVRRAKEQASLSPKQAAALAETVAKIEARQAKQAASAHIGKPGERIETEVEVERVNTFPSSFGGSFHIVVMRTPDGEALVSKGKFCAEKGDVMRIKATVSEHGEFRDEKQTMVQRVAVVAAREPAELGS